jgi:hypothetical protein
MRDSEKISRQEERDTIRQTTIAQGLMPRMVGLQLGGWHKDDI